MSSLTIFTTMTNPESRNDPWREALECYNHFADEVVTEGKDWPTEFSWEYIGEIFQKGILIEHHHGFEDLIFTN